MRPLALAIILTITWTLQADILHLRDGSRHYGQAVLENDREVVFRIVLPGGSGSVLKTFSRDLVVRVERTSTRQLQTRPAKVPTSSEADEDYEQMLREGFELVDDGQPLAALRALQYAVSRAPPAMLEQLTEQCRTARGVPLDELLARTRLEVADSGRAGQAFRLQYVTPFESAALGRLLQQMQVERLARRHDDRTIAEWAAAPADYTAVRPDSRALVADASRVAAVISARLRFDPSLRGQREERARLVELRANVSRLAAHILALPGYTAPTEDDGATDPAELEAARLAAASAPTSQPAPEDGQHE